MNFKEKYQKNDVEEWFCSGLSRVILVIFIFFRVNDNTMHSYYRHLMRRSVSAGLPDFTNQMIVYCCQSSVLVR